MSFMNLTPAIAALMGAGITGSLTLLAGLSTQWLTRSREREQRVWERRAGVYEDLLVVHREFADDRRKVRRTGVMGEAQSADLSEGMARIEAKLEIYGSRKLIDAHKRHFEATKDWFVAFVKWDPQAGSSKPPAPGADPEWDRVLEKMGVAEEAEKGLMAEIRRDTHVLRRRPL